MALPTFHCFVRLPLEIRCLIYLYATPPRIVHVKEYPLEDEKEFYENFRTQPLPPNFCLHPSLSYFAHKWRDIIPRALDTTQTSLLQYGFTTSKPTVQPWEPSPECPEIPLHSLIDCKPWVFWELARPSYLYSAAPIPAFLHVCSESRRFLESQGYERAFSTRTSGPRTWTCFKNDILYLEKKDYDSYRELTVLTCENLGLGAFMPEDLKRVKRLAVFDSILSENISTALRLFGGVQEFFAVENNLNDKWRRDKLVGSSEGDSAWGWVECDEADLLYRSLCSDTHAAANMRLRGCDGSMLIDYKKRHDGSSHGFFDHISKASEGHFMSLRAKVLQTVNTVPWSIPSLKYVHVGTTGMMKVLFDMRDRYWKALQDQQFSELHCGLARSERTRVLNQPSRRRLSPFPAAWQDDDDGYRETLH